MLKPLKPKSCLVSNALKLPNCFVLLDLKKPVKTGFFYVYNKVIDLKPKVTMMKFGPIFLGVALAIASLGAVADASPVGIWKTIDDETGQPKSLVQIAMVDGELQGKVIRLFRKPTEEQNPVCDQCEGARHNQPIIGMTILWGLKAEGEYYSGGKILDPKNGKIYKARLKTLDNGKQLEMRGFIGFSLLGRTQHWVRENP